MSENPQKPQKPSDSLRPGVTRFLGLMTVDPLFLILRLIGAVAEGVTKAVLEWRDKRKEKKAAKKPKKGEKHHGP